MKRIDAIRAIVEMAADYPVVANCAATTRELSAIEDRPNHLYLLDSMGLTSSVALGLALALKDSSFSRVIALEGDGALFMNMGSLASIGFLRPTNLVLALLDNQSYASTGGIPTYSGKVDLGDVAESCGLTVHRAADRDGIARSLRQGIEAPGPHLLHIQIDASNAAGIPLVLEDPVVVAHRFRTWLAERPSSAARSELNLLSE